jgi:hypothetical protein
MLAQGIGITMSLTTIHRVLKEGGLHAVPKTKKPLLSKKNTSNLTLTLLTDIRIGQLQIGEGLYG